MAYSIEYEVRVVTPSGYEGAIPFADRNEAFEAAADAATMSPSFIVTVLSRLVGTLEPVYVGRDWS